MEPLIIKSFGILAEKLPQSEFEFPYQKDSDELLKALNTKYPFLADLKFSLAVDKQLVQENTPLKGNEEIALLPPFSGG